MQNQIESNLGNIADGGVKQIEQAIGTLDLEQRQIVRDVLFRQGQLGVLSIGATSEQLIQNQRERAALNSTLLSLGEEKAATASAVAGAIFDRVFAAALNVALGRLGL